ncbi:MAG: CoA transferase [Flavobacteriales bacterium]|nr:CoA transferase [Flavobacteriales bacterium]
MAGQLKDLLVLEAATVLAGPSVGFFFAELGARVVKVEPPHGDATRAWKLPVEPAGNPLSAYFSSVNWGKEHMRLDLKDASDRDRFDALVRVADILITNHMADDAVKLGLDRERLLALNPRLIHGHIKGFAEQPDRPAYDVVLQAECGYISMTGSGPGQFAKMPIALIDLLAAHQLKEGLLIALLRRERSGKGAFVDVSLEEAALAGLINQASNFMMAGAVARPLGTLHPNIAPYGEVLRCADEGRIILAVGSDAQFMALCAVIGAPALATDARFSSSSLRVQNRTALADLLEPVFASHMRDALLGRLLSAGVPCGAVRSIDEVLASPAARRMTLASAIDGQPTLRLSGNAFRVEG